MQIRNTLAHLNLSKSSLIILSLRFHVVGIILEPSQKTADASHGVKVSLVNLEGKMDQI